MPAIVETKMDNSVQPFNVSPEGTGTRKRKARPSPMVSSSGNGFAPGHAFGAAFSVDVPVHTIADAHVCITRPSSCQGILDTTSNLFACIVQKSYD